MRTRAECIALFVQRPAGRAEMEPTDCGSLSSVCFRVRLVLPARVQVKRSETLSGKNVPVKHTGRACTALPSLTTSNLRPSASIPGLLPVCVRGGPFYPCLACRQRCRILDHYTALQFNTGTRRRAANSHASRPSAYRPTNLAATAACTSHASVTAESHSKRRGVVKMIQKANSGTKRQR